MPRQTPTTSTVRTALLVAEQFEELLRSGRRGQPAYPTELADVLATVIQESRKLQSHQVDDLVAHLHAIADEEPVPESQARREVDRLADFILDCPLAEPARDESAVDTAIRLIGRLADAAPRWQPPEDGPGPETAEPDVEGGEDTIKPEEPYEGDDDVAPEEARRRADAAAARVRGDGP